MFAPFCWDRAGRGWREDTCEVAGLRLKMALFMADTCSLFVPLLATCASIDGKTKLLTNHCAVVRVLLESERRVAPCVISLVWVV